MVTDEAWKTSLKIDVFISRHLPLIAGNPIEFPFQHKSKGPRCYRQSHICKGGKFRTWLATINRQEPNREPISAKFFQTDEN